MLEEGLHKSISTPALQVLEKLSTTIVTEAMEEQNHTYRNCLEVQVVHTIFEVVHLIVVRGIPGMQQQQIIHDSL